MSVVVNKVDPKEQQKVHDLGKRVWHTPELKKIDIQKITNSFDVTSLFDTPLLVT